MPAFAVTPNGNSGNNLIVIGILIVGAAVLWWIQKLLTRRRTRQVTESANDIGFTFEGADWTDPRHAPRMETRLFERNGSYRNVMTGSSGGLRVSLFDYTYRQGSGRNSRNYTQTIAAFQKSDASIPYFDLWPRGTLDRIKDTFSHKNIQFDSHPGFSDRYELQSPVEENVKQTFTSSMLSFSMHRLGRKLANGRTGRYAHYLRTRRKGRSGSIAILPRRNVLDRQHFLWPLEGSYSRSEAGKQPVGQLIS